MTPSDLAVLITPQIQAAAEWSKDDILAIVTPVQRVFVRAFWGIMVARGVPLITRIVIEFLVLKYRTTLEPSIGEMVNLLLQSMDEEEVPQLQVLKDILSVLQTPENQLHPSVQAYLAARRSPDTPNPS